MNGFMSQYLWIKDVLRDEVVEEYNILIDDDSRPAKTNLFSSLYDDFLKLNVRSFFMLKTIDAFVMKTLDKFIFLALIKPIMAIKIKLLERNLRRSPPREIVIQDRNDE